jgi:23S rRNA pseudouridine1911/1915/1917 synthase
VLSKRVGLERQWLHALRLGFEHPDSGDYVQYESTYPDDLASALEVVREAH